ncbi:MAG: hypothetical protein NTY87_04775 [Planctomycetia bacterium]|nr:hypothetical protein [Planctomycetia bacterium]
MQKTYFSRVLAVFFALVIVLSAITVSAEVTSGPQVGDSVGAFTVTKVAGNPDDGFAVGKSGCYRCKTGSKPVVMVFARTGNESLAKLLKKIDEEVEEHQAEKLTSFVNMLGTDAETVKKATEEFVKKNGITRIAFVVPEDLKDGPPDFNIAKDADVTVVCYKSGTVTANHAFAAGQLSDEKIDAVVAASCKLVE